MASTSKKTGEHLFSIQLKSKDYVKSVAMPNDEEGNVLIEGFLGKLENVSFTEGIMLEIDGAHGSLKMDLTEKELKTLLPKRTRLRTNSYEKSDLNEKQGEVKRIEA